jgi:hypothetical protein
MHLLYVAGGLVFWVGVDYAAVRVILGIVFGRAYVVACVAAGTLSGFGWCG